MDASTMVKRVRALNGLTRVDLARLADVAPSTISRIEAGALDPTWTMLKRVLDSAGFKIVGDTLASAGDAAAVSSARALLERRPRNTGSDVWAERWERAGWVSAAKGVNVAAIGNAAGNAAKFSRRDVETRYVEPPGTWQDLARALDAAGVGYAVSGLVATRPDRLTSPAASPIFYVADPADAIATLGLEQARPGWGVMLVTPQLDEIEGAEVEGGIRFTSRVQALLDAFASAGREPDNAEAVALAWQDVDLAAI